MRIQAIRKKLKKHGYFVTFCLSGKYIASKNQRTYISKTLNGIYNQVFRKL